VSISIPHGPAGLTFTAECAFTTDPTSSSPSWTDISAYVLKFSLDRGRQHEYERVEAGRLELTLKNTDGRFDPSNASGPYYANLFPMRRVRLSFTLSGVTYYVFSGYAERWPRSRKGATWSQVDLVCSDAFPVFATAVISGSLPQEFSGSRIGRVLDQIAWPAGDRNIDAGQAQVQSVSYSISDDQNGLAHLQDVETSEAGFLYMTGDGKVRFLNRHALVTDPYTTSQATFSDKPTGGEVGYIDIVPALDIDLIVNDWIGTRGGGAVQEALDSFSQTRYFRRSQTRDTLLTNDTEQLDQLKFLLSRSKDAYQRYEQVTFKPGTSSTAWTQMLLRDLGDRITLKENPPTVSTISQDVNIQRIHIEGQPGGGGAFRCTWGVYPADIANYWIAGHAANSLAGQTTRPGY
jgi:hypothetical protein